MNVNSHLDSRSPITQSIEAVKSLLAYVGRASDPLPIFLELPGKQCMLVLANKKDVYYTVTPRACSCPSSIYRPGKACKHQRKYFPEAAIEDSDALLESIKPEGKWAGGYNGPVDPETTKEVHA